MEEVVEEEVEEGGRWRVDDKHSPNARTAGYTPKRY